MWICCAPKDAVTLAALTAIPKLSKEVDSLSELSTVAVSAVISQPLLSGTEFLMAVYYPGLLCTAVTAHKQCEKEQDLGLHPSVSPLC